MTTILQILPNLNSGGVERGTIEISKAIIAQGYKSIVISQGGSLIKKLEETGALHLTLKVGSKNPWIIYRNSIKLIKIIKEYKVGIIHARSRAPAWSAYLASKKTKAKFITSFHGVYSGKSWLKKSYNSVMLKSEKIITVSNFITNHITKNYNFTQTDKLHLIHRGVDIDLFKQSQKQLTNNNKYIKKWQIPQDKKIILMPGRITEWKGQDILIKALKQLSYHDYYCIIIGDSGKHPNFLHRLESLISANKLQSNITIKPNILDIELLYQLADIVVSASTRPEAFGRIMIEAGAMSKVMVATNHGGAMETIIDNETGFLAQHNNAEDLAKAINKALNLSKEAKEQMEKKAHLHIAQNFSITKMQQKTIALYNSLLN